MHWQYPEPSRSYTKVSVLRKAVLLRPLEVDCLVLVQQSIFDRDFKGTKGDFLTITKRYLFVIVLFEEVVVGELVNCASLTFLGFVCCDAFWCIARDRFCLGTAMKMKMKMYVNWVAHRKEMIDGVKRLAVH